MVTQKIQRLGVIICSKTYRPETIKVVEMLSGARPLAIGIIRIRWRKDFGRREHGISRGAAAFAKATEGHGLKLALVITTGIHADHRALLRGERISHASTT